MKSEGKSEIENRDGKKENRRKGGTGERERRMQRGGRGAFSGTPSFPWPGIGDATNTLAAVAGPVYARAFATADKQGSYVKNTKLNVVFTLSIFISILFYVCFVVFRVGCDFFRMNFLNVNIVKILREK